MPKTTRRQPADYEEVADAHLALVKDLLRQAYGRTWLAEARTLRRHLQGLHEDVRRRYLE